MGRIYKPKYAWTKTDGTRVEKTTVAWYIEYRSATGKTIRRKAGLSRKQAQDALRKAESEVLSEKNGLPGRSAKDEPLAELLERYLQAQRPNWSRDHAYIREKQLRHVLRSTKAYAVKDLTPEKLERVLDDLQAGGRAVRTVNLYLVAAKAFFTWAATRCILPYNPLLCVQPRRGPQKRPRRALTIEEGCRLIAAALEGPRRRMERAYRGRFQDKKRAVKFSLEFAARLEKEGRSFALAYQLCMTCGLRKEEMRRLTWQDVDFDASVLILRGDKGALLSGTYDVVDIPIPIQTLDALKSRRAESDSTGPQDRVVPVRENLCLTLNDDLEAAGIPKIDVRGRVVDVHALRHTCGTWLNNAGVDPKSIQTIMRHKDIKTTYGTYIHTENKRLHAAANALPVLGAPAPASCAHGAPERAEIGLKTRLGA